MRKGARYRVKCIAEAEGTGGLVMRVVVVVGGGWGWG